MDGAALAVCDLGSLGGAADDSDIHVFSPLRKRRGSFDLCPPMTTLNSDCVLFENFDRLYLVLLQNERERERERELLLLLLLMMMIIMMNLYFSLNK